MPHRESVRAYLEAIRLDGQLIYDWGCGTKPVKKYIKHDGSKFVGIDKLDHVGADIVADITGYLDLEENCDSAFCMETLEHVKAPEYVLKNIYNNLKFSGNLFFSVPFLYPVHSEEDYWRFTDQGIRLLLDQAGFTVIEILPTEGNMGWVGRAVKNA